MMLGSVRATLFIERANYVYSTSGHNNCDLQRRRSSRKTRQAMRKIYVFPKGSFMRARVSLSEIQSSNLLLFRLYNSAETLSIDCIYIQCNLLLNLRESNSNVYNVVK